MRISQTDRPHAPGTIASAGRAIDHDPLAIIRTAFYLLRRAFARSGPLGATLITFEKIIAFGVWLCVALYLTGLWADVFQYLEHTELPLGKHKVSLAAILQGAVSVVVLLMVALWAGTLVMLVFARIPPSTYAYVSPWFYSFCLIMLIAVAVVGDVRLGAQRWLTIPGVTSVQPSEFLKLAMPMMSAWYLSSRPQPLSMKDVGISLTLILLPVGLIAEQPDLGTSILVFSSGFFVIFLGGLPWRFMAAIATAFAVCAPIGWGFLHDYQRRRIHTLFDPESDPLGNGWNKIGRASCRERVSSPV